jgi:hypothetical protein
MYLSTMYINSDDMPADSSLTYYVNIMVTDLHDGRQHTSFRRIVEAMRSHIPEGQS